MPLNFPDDWGVRKGWTKPPESTLPIVTKKGVIILNESEEGIKVGDRIVIECPDFRGDKGVIKYIVKHDGCYSYMIIFDQRSFGSHDGNGGCERYGVPKLPEYEGRCFWLSRTAFQKEEE